MAEIGSSWRSLPGSGRGRRDALIGRAEELARLVRALDDAGAGRASVALVGGDAGVGKTRLTGELAGIARERGHTVLVGQCAELGEAIPYLPLADALRHATRDPATAPRVMEALASRPVLGRLLPDGGDDAFGGGGPGELAQQQLFGSTLGLLGELSDARPVVLVLEDLHWADRSTRDLLTFLSRMLQHERVLLVGTYRTDDLYRTHPLRPVIAELLRLPSVAGVVVRPFDDTEMAEYLAALAGGRPSLETLERVMERAEGNPFYAAELLAVATTGEELPAALADLLVSRVDRLGDDARLVVRVAAVAGRHVTDDLVRSVCGLDQRAYERALREIVSHRLLVADGEDGLAFRHALLREAVYADLLPGERTRWHAAFAALLRDAALLRTAPVSGPGHGAGNGNGPGTAAPATTGGGLALPPGPGSRRRSAAELAYHSLASHDLPGALTASVAAGREAARLGAPAEAHEHFAQALSLWDVVPEQARPDGVDRGSLTLSAAAAAAHSGAPHRAITYLKRLRETLEPAADPLMYATVSERLAHHLSDVSADPEAIETIRSVVEMLPPDPPTPQRARALATYSRTVLYIDQAHDLVPSLADQAIAAARATGAADAEATALINLGLYIEVSSPEPRAAQLFAEATEVARRAGDLSVALRAGYHSARAAYESGDFTAAARIAEQGVRFTHEHGLAWSTYGIDLRFLEYLVHYTVGDWERAERLAGAFPVRVGTVAEAQVSAYALFLEVARGGDAVEQRLVWLERFWAQDSLVAYIARGLAAEHCWWNGDERGALDHVTAVVDALDPADSGLVRVAAVGLAVLADRAERARAAGDEPTATATIEAAERLIERSRWAAGHIAGGPREWLGLEGRAWLARAEAEWLRARGEDRPESWQAVVDAFDHGFTYELARSRLRLSVSLLATGERAEAQEQWRRAFEVVTRLRAAPLRRTLLELARRAGFEAGAAGADETGGRDGNGGNGGNGPGRAASAGPLAGLTPREREVLRLVADGRNNREIAAELFISPKTASVHVSNILAKLGVSSRTQAAAVVHREASAASPDHPG